MTKKFVIAKLENCVNDDYFPTCDKCGKIILSDTYHEAVEVDAYGDKMCLCTDCYLSNTKNGIDEVMKLKQFKWTHFNTVQHHTCDCCHFDENGLFFFNENGDAVCTKCYHRHIKPPIRKKNLI